MGPCMLPINPDCLPVTPGAESPEEFSAIAEVASAEEAAKNKEGNKVVKHLKSAGKFALDTAQKIGVSLAAEVIQKQMGM